MSLARARHIRNIDKKKIKLFEKSPRAKAEGASKDQVLIYFSVIIICAIFLQRFAITIGGFQFQIAFFIAMVSLLLMLKKGIIQVSKSRLILYLFAISVLSFTTFMTKGTAALTSFGLLVVIYSWYIFEAPISRVQYISILNVYQRAILVIACAGILQQILQHFIKSPLLFTFEGFLPDDVLFIGYNTVIPLRFGSVLNKSNGFFLLEPSTFSQYLAAAIIIEMLFFSVSYRMLVYLFGMLIAYSGTGLILLTLFSPIAFIINKRFDYLFAFVLVGIGVLLFGDVLNLEVFQERTQEFSAKRSSAVARFIGPVYLIEANLGENLQAFIFGTGPGSFMDYAAQAGHPAFSTTCAKIFFEYGLLGFAGFLSFYFFAMFSKTFSTILSAAYSFKFLFLGGFLLSQVESMLIFTLVILPISAKAAKSLR